MQASSLRSRSSRDHFATPISNRATEVITLRLCSSASIGSISWP